jgi:NTP pyrophosphatase (non-canonical NTP hydrolase)
MTFQELLEFIDIEDARLRDRYGKNFSTEKEVILAKAVKLSEEVGELSSEVLGYNGDQRKEKLDQQTADSLPNELADVVITTLLLAKSLHVDIQDALAKKIQKINSRYA